MSQKEREIIIPNHHTITNLKQMTRRRNQRVWDTVFYTGSKGIIANYCYNYNLWLLSTSICVYNISEHNSEVHP